MKSIFANSHYLSVWLKESREALQQNPDDQNSLLVHFALSKLQSMDLNSSTAADRQKIFDYFEQAARKGDAYGMFFSGLCYLEGFGCQKNPAIGQSLISLCAIWRNCHLAQNYINLYLGLTYLYGDRAAGIQTNWLKGLQFLILAKDIAEPHVIAVAEHVNAQELRQDRKRSFQTYQEGQIQTPPREPAAKYHRPSPVSLS